MALLAASCSPLAPSPADAQQAAAGTPDEDVPAAERPEASASLQDIVVTARRRAEPLQRTPVSVVALSAQELESRSVTNTRTLQNFIPNLTFAASQNVGEAAANIFIRGIGQEDFGIGAEPGVGIYVDGVYFARPLGMIMNLIDLDRIEVLRGPQGTLFGKNTIGGAINVLSNLPVLDRQRRASVILGNFDRFELRAVANEPLSRNLLARVSVGFVRQDGYLRRLPPPTPLAAIEAANLAAVDLRREGGLRSQAARLRLRLLVTDTVTADLSLDGSRKRDTQGATHIDAVNLAVGIFPVLNRLIREGQLPGPEITPDFFADDVLESRAGGRNFVDQDIWGASTVVAKEFGRNTLKFIGAYRGLRSRVGTDTDGLYFNILGSNIRADQRQLSGEFQLTGESTELSYAAGLFMIEERSNLRPTVSILNEILFTCGCFRPPGRPPIFTTEPRELKGGSYAGYAQGTYGFTDRLSATIGARLSHEKKRIDGKAFRLDADLQPTDIQVATGSNRDRWNSVTYRAGLEFQATNDLMAYGSAARGFKSGGFNARGAPELANMGFYSFKPETALTYELGLRSEWLERRLRLNATVFHTDYRDIQLRRQTFVDGLVATLIENAARARIKGAEIEITAAPLEGLTLTAAYGHLDPHYLDVGRVPGLTPSSRFQRTPSHSLSASVNYERSVGPGTLELHGDFSYRSKEQFQITPAINDQQGYGLLGARLTYRARDDRWAVALFGTNLTQQRYRVAGRGTLLDQSGVAYSNVGMPRQIGIQLTSRF